MSKQLKPNQWLELFDIHETQGTHALCSNMEHIEK